MIGTQIMQASEPAVQESCTVWRCVLCDSLVWINSGICFSNAVCPVCRSIDLLFFSRGDKTAEDSYDNS